MVRPVAVNVTSDLGNAMAALGASLPLTYSWRLLVPLPTSATQMFFVVSYGFQAVTCRAPLSTGCAPGAASQVMVCPLRPASRAVNVSGRGSR